MFLKKTTLVCCVATLSLSAAQAKNSYDPTNDLITAYCAGNVGEHSRTALNQAEALKDTIARIKDDAACRDVYAISMSLYNNLIQLGTMYEEKKSSQEFKVNRLYDEMEKERAQLVDAHILDYVNAHPGATSAELAQERIDYTPSSTLLTALENSYAQAKVSLISTNITKDDPEQYSEQVERLNRIASIKTGVENLFGALKTSTECSKNYGNLLSQMGAQVLGTAGSLYSGIVGAAMLAGSVFISGTSDLITHIKYNTKINDLSNARLQFALGCSLEGIAKTYCEARDTQTILRNIDTVQMARTDLNVFKGISLLTKEILPYNKWVKRIVAGSNPSNTIQAQERNNAFNLRNQLEIFKQNLEGSINETANTINNLSGSADDILNKKNTFTLALMNKLVGIINPYNGGENAYGASFANDMSCGHIVYIYSLGKSRIKDNANSLASETCTDYARRIYADTFSNPPSLEILRGLIDVVNTEATDYATLKLNQVLEENPRLVMALYDSADPKTLSTPRDFLEGAALYLNKFRGELGVSNTKLIRLIEKTMTQINEAISIINGDIAEDLQISRLGVLLAPNQITLSVNNALREIVKQDIDLKLKSGNLGSEDLQFLLKANPTNGVDLFTKYYLNLQKVEDDAAFAKNMTKKNLETFGSLFADIYLKNLTELKKELGRNSSNDVRRQIGLNCLESLLVPDESTLHQNKVFGQRSKKLDKVCLNAIYPSSNPGQVADLSYSELRALNFEERVCRIYDFKRKLQLYEMLR